jgi:hypothetical protein
MTPKDAWSNIQHIIPRNKVIWEPFFGNGKSGDFLRELGFNVIHDDDDFFESNKGDIIVTNPPFTKIKNIMIRLKELNKPFILILPASKICTSYIREFNCNVIDKLQIMIPRRRIQFNKLINGAIPEGWSNRCNFDCFYYCYKMNLEHDIIFLNHNNNI